MFPGEADEHGDKRGSVDSLMGYLREFADSGVAVLAVSSVGRTKDAKGRSRYDGDGLNLASFKESSELEFAADDAFMLTSSGDDGERVLKHLKARHSQPRDIALRFRGSCMSFTPLETFPTGDFPIETKGKLTAALANAWGRKDAADDEREGF